MLVRQLGQQAHRLAVVDNLLRFRGAEDDGADVSVLGRPREGELGRRTAQLLGDGGELFHFFDLGFALRGLELFDFAAEQVAVVVQAGTFRDAVVVFPRQEPARQRRPDRRAVAELVEQRRVFDLESLAVECVVLRLFGDGGDEVVFFGNLRGFHDLHGRPFARAPVVCQVEVSDCLGEALDDLLHWGGVVGSVGEDDVDVWLLQAGQGALESFHNVFLGETARVRFLSAGTEEDFCDEDVFVAGPGKLFQGGPHLDFALAVGIDLQVCDWVSLRTLEWIW